METFFSSKIVKIQNRVQKCRNISFRNQIHRRFEDQSLPLRLVVYDFVFTILLYVECRTKIQEILIFHCGTPMLQRSIKQWKF